MKNSHVLEVDSVSRSFGPLKALDNVSLEVGTGEVYGLLGPNGSGKSTLMKMMLGLIKPDSGTIKVDGIDVQNNPLQVRRIVGYVPESPRIYEFLTAIEYLDFIADIHQMDIHAKKERISEFLRAFELEGRENEMLRDYR